MLPGVTVTITSQDRGFSRETVSDGNGRYVFPAVPIGLYTVSATLQGFQTATVTDNLVEVEKTTSVPFDMSIGALTDTVQVIGETPIVDRDDRDGDDASQQGRVRKAAGRPQLSGADRRRAGRGWHRQRQ